MSAPGPFAALPRRPVLRRAADRQALGRQYDRLQRVFDASDCRSPVNLWCVCWLSDPILRLLRRGQTPFSLGINLKTKAFAPIVRAEGLSAPAFSHETKLECQLLALRVE